MGIGKRILNVLIGLLFIISVTVLGSSFLAKKVLVDAISQAGVDTAISHRMMDAVFGYAGADDTEWIAKIQNKIEKNGEVQAITQKVMNEITEDLSSGKAYKDVDVTKELNRILDDSMQEIKDTNPELNDDMLVMMKQQLKEELVDVQDVLNSYASNLYDNMNDTSTVQGKVAKLYTILLSMPCRVAAGAAILILAVLTILLGYPRYRGLFSLGVEGLICSVIFAPGIGLMETQHIIHNFEPIYNEHSKILMLGTMPSPKSREVGFYYGHPRNRFWKVVSDVCGEAYPETREDKITFALRNGIAVWDVLAGCDIKGADDSSIRNPQPNDMSRILECADIKAIFTTGTKAFQLYKKFCYPKTGIMAIGLPSTSPANCRTSYEQLYEAYFEIRKYLE